MVLATCVLYNFLLGTSESHSSYKYVCMYVCMCVCVYIYIYVCVCVCVCVRALFLWIQKEQMMTRITHSMMTDVRNDFQQILYFHYKERVMILIISKRVLEKS
jgi:hypothetical protein